MKKEMKLPRTRVPPNIVIPDAKKEQSRAACREHIIWCVLDGEECCECGDCQ